MAEVAAVRSQTSSRSFCRRTRRLPSNPRQEHYIPTSKAPPPRGAPPAKRLAPFGIVQPLLDVREHPARASMPKSLRGETGAQHLQEQLLRTMEIRRGEVVEALGRVAVLPILEITLDDAREAVVGEQIANQAIERGRVTGDPRREQNATGPQHARRLAQRGPSVGRVDQVVQRAEQEHAVHGRIGNGKRARPRRGRKPGGASHSSRDGGLRR